MPLSIKVNLRVTGHCNQGGRKYMEDMFSVAYQQTSDDKDLEYAFFGIFDGHGGSEAATFAKEHLMDIIVKQRNFWSDKDEDVIRAIRDGYVNTHYAMWRELDKWPRTASGLPSTAGTTASVAFIRKGKIYIGHVGDSGIILGYQDEDDPQWKARALTKDHKPESGPEMMRIQESGGKVVSKSGVPRVVWNRPRIGHKGPVRRSTHIDEIPFLAVARSLGDLWSYNSELDTFVVSPEPDVKVVTVDVKSHRCLIFGTDGLWNMLTPPAAVAIVQAAERHNEKHLIASQQTGNPHADVQMWINPSKSLVDRALEKWSMTRLRADNTSVVTLMLDPPGPSRSEVLMSRKKECEPLPKSVTTPFHPHASSTPVNTIAVPLSEPIFNPITPVVPSNLEVINPKNPDSSIDVYKPSKIDNTADKIAEVQDIAGSLQVTDEKLGGFIDNPENVLASTSRESIQVAEISSSGTSDEVVDVRNDDPKIVMSSDVSTKEIPADDTKIPFQGGPSELDRDITPDADLILNNKTSVSDNSLLEKDLGKIGNQSNLVRQNAFCGSCDEFKSGPRLRRTGGSCNNSLPSTLDRSHEQDQPPVAAIGGASGAPKRRQSQGSSLGSHLETKRVRRRQSVNTITYLSERQKSFPSPVGARLKREIGLRSYRERTIESIEVRTTKTLTNTTVESKRRHSSTIAPAEEADCGIQEPSAKRRTRSEDRPNPIDENDPTNQEKSEQHSRLRWPDESGVSARSRSGSMTGFCGTTSVSSNGQEKLSSPNNSFQRRSLEKKATPVKTIRRPSINGSSRVQLRGSFALRDWDQSKSGRHSSCNDRSRLNRTVGGVIGSTTDSSPAPSLQRWLRSDTLAATPVKTLRSRKVDIVTGHTVPAQVAHQYGVAKQNRLSLSAKIKLAGKVSKSTSPALSTSKLPKQSPGSNSTGSTTSGTGSSTSSGITKRVKSPYNPSARSALGTRSRLKRLGK